MQARLEHSEEAASKQKVNHEASENRTGTAPGVPGWDEKEPWFQYRN